MISSPVPRGGIITVLYRGQTKSSPRVELVLWEERYVMFIRYGDLLLQSSGILSCHPLSIPSLDCFK